MYMYSTTYELVYVCIHEYKQSVMMVVRAFIYMYVVATSKTFYSYRDIEAIIRDHNESTNEYTF